jgi:hypothetical protein
VQIGLDADGGYDMSPPSRAGEYDFAASEKRRLEEKQRAARKELQDEAYPPLWFDHVFDESTGTERYLGNGKYWEARKSGAFPERDIYGTEP